MKYICQHLGIGDHLICNGLVRTIYNPNEEYTMFVKEKYLDSVSFMFRDLKNFSFITGEAENNISFLQRNHINSDDIIYAGFSWVDMVNHSFDENFYLQNNVDFNNKWSNFYVERDEQRENRLFDHFDIQEPYVFIHEDDQRGFSIDRNLLPEVRVIKADNNLTNNIFDYLKIMENAEQIHCIESSFLHLADLTSINDNIIFHSYSRQHPGNFFQPKYKNVKFI